MYVGPRGAVWAMCAARRIASYAAGTEAGWLSHLVKSRTSAAWSEAVWIQSIQGRRFAASQGPVAPRTSIGTRSHQALEIATLACMSPTLEWTTAPIIRSETLA